MIQLLVRWLDVQNNRGENMKIILNDEEIRTALVEALGKKVQHIYMINPDHCFFRATFNASAISIPDRGSSEELFSVEFCCEVS